ncbi:hypothetical protein ACFWQC_09670 [Nocardioides sp. NPDC058538]|uniref:hypothetical protein n=1 Tax=Nocardioides sp. NPDC058538 TaxID=3346542 RepID=UPI003651D598
MSRRGELGRSVLLFVGFGLGWAVAARLFMRCFTDDPSFTLQGTGMISGLVLLEFIGLGFVRGARLSGRTRWWRLAPVPGLLLFFGPGMLLVPFVLTGVVLGRCRRPLVRVLVTLVGASASVAPIVILSRGATDNPPAPTLAAGMVLYVGCGLALVAATQEWSRPWRRPLSTGDSLLQPVYASEP